MCDEKSSEKCCLEYIRKIYIRWYTNRKVSTQKSKSKICKCP